MSFYWQFLCSLVYTIQFLSNICLQDLQEWWVIVCSWLSATFRNKLRKGQIYLKFVRFFHIMENVNEWCLFVTQLCFLPRKLLKLIRNSEMVTVSLLIGLETACSCFGVNLIRNECFIYYLINRVCEHSNGYWQLRTGNNQSKKHATFWVRCVKEKKDDRRRKRQHPNDGNLNLYCQTKFVILKQRLLFKLISFEQRYFNPKALTRKVVFRQVTLTRFAVYLQWLITIILRQVECFFTLGQQ